jgi:hypothetical protein
MSANPYIKLQQHSPKRQANGLPLFGPSKLRPRWKIEAQKDLMATEKPALLPDYALRWGRECPQADWLYYAMEFSAVRDALKVDGVAALLNDGRFVPASDPSRTDIWIIISDDIPDSPRNFVMAYNGEKAVRCILIQSQTLPDSWEVWLDLAKSMEWLSQKDREMLNELVRKVIT